MVSCKVSKMSFVILLYFWNRLPLMRQSLVKRLTKQSLVSGRLQDSGVVEYRRQIQFSLDPWVRHSRTVLFFDCFVLFSFCQLFQRSRGKSWFVKFAIDIGLNALTRLEKVLITFIDVKGYCCGTEYLQSWIHSTKGSYPTSYINGLIKLQLFQQRKIVWGPIIIIHNWFIPMANIECKAGIAIVR